MKPCACGHLIADNQKRCRTCTKREYNQAQREADEAISRGYCHAGYAITDVPAETLTKVTQWHAQKAKREAQAEIGRRIQAATLAEFFAELEQEELAAEVYRPKMGMRASVVCPRCKSKLTEGRCWKCH